MAVSGASAVAAMARARADLVARTAAADAADVLMSEVLSKAYAPPASGDGESEKEDPPADRVNTSGAVRSAMTSVVEYHGMLLHPITDDAGDVLGRTDLVAEIDVTHVVPSTLASDPEADTGLVEIRVRVLRRVDANGVAVGGAVGGSVGGAGASTVRDVLLLERVAYRGRTSVLEAGT